METEFKNLNPMLTHNETTGHYISFNCPLCGFRSSLYVNLNGTHSDDGVRRAWGLVVPDNDWSKATLSPSIGNFPHPLGKPCVPHFSVINGKIIP